jgi:hypothetical protein
MLFQIESFNGASEILGRVRPIRFHGNELTICGITGIAEAKKILERIANGLHDEDLIASSELLHQSKASIPDQNAKREELEKAFNTQGVTSGRLSAGVVTNTPKESFTETPSTETKPRRGRPPKDREPAEPASLPLPHVPPVVAPSPAAQEATPAEPKPRPDFFGTPIPDEVLSATRWEVVIKFLLGFGYDSSGLYGVCVSDFREDVPLLKTVDTEYVQECIDMALENIRKEEEDKHQSTPGNPSEISDETIKSFETLRPLLKYLLDCGVQRDKLVDVCEEKKSISPVLKNFSNIKPRVEFMLTAME